MEGAPLDKITLGVIIFAFAVWAIKEVYSTMKGDTRRNTEATMQNTLAVIDLRLRMEAMTKALEELPRIKKDIDEAHRMIRAFRPKDAPI